MSQEWPTSIFFQQYKLIIKKKGFKNWWNGSQKGNALIFYQVLFTKSWRKCMEKGLENFYVDIGYLWVKLLSY